MNRFEVWKRRNYWRKKTCKCGNRLRKWVYASIDFDWSYDITTIPGGFRIEEHLTCKKCADALILLRNEKGTR